MVSLSGCYTTYTTIQPLREPTRAPVMYYTPIYIAYRRYEAGQLVFVILVFVIRISVPFTSLCQRIARCLPQARCLCSKNVAIGFKTGRVAYFVGKTALGRRSSSR